MKLTLAFGIFSSVLSLCAAQSPKAKHHHHGHDALKREDVGQPAGAAPSLVHVGAGGAIYGDHSSRNPDLSAEVGRAGSVISHSHDQHVEDILPRGTARLWSFTYAPFKANGNCKNADEIKRDFASLRGEYSLVRIYGTSCDQVANVLAAAQKYNLKIFAGIFDINQLEQEAAAIISAAKNDWSRFETISVGNELVNSVPEDQKSSMANNVIAAIGKARSILRAAGYKGKIVTVDTLVASRAYPSLCEASDFCAVNCHPFFDGGVTASAAGQFITEQAATLAKVIPKGKKIIITETGWPWKGSNNRMAVPSLSNQAAALSSIRNAFKSNKAGVILFTIYNDNWKKDNEWTFGAERYWGVNGVDAPSG